MMTPAVGRLPSARVRNGSLECASTHGLPCYLLLCSAPCRRHALLAQEAALEGHAASSPPRPSRTASLLDFADTSLGDEEGDELAGTRGSNLVADGDEHIGSERKAVQPSDRGAATAAGSAAARRGERENNPGSANTPAKKRTAPPGTPASAKRGASGALAAPNLPLAQARKPTSVVGVRTAVGSGVSSRRAAAAGASTVGSTSRAALGGGAAKQHR